MFLSLKVLSSWQSQLGAAALQRAAASFALRGDTAAHGRRLRQVTLRAAEGWLPKLEVQRPLQLVLQKWILEAVALKKNVGSFFLFGGGVWYVGDVKLVLFGNAVREASQGFHW